MKYQKGDKINVGKLTIEILEVSQDEKGNPIYVIIDNNVCKKLRCTEPALDDAIKMFRRLGL